MKKITKTTIITAILSFALILPTIPGNAASNPKTILQSTDYKNGKIELDFKRDMNERADLKITVTDEKKSSYNVQYYNLDDDDLDIYVKGLPSKQTITVKVSGLKSASGTSYDTLTAQFKTDSNDILIEEIQASRSGVVEVDFKSDVTWRDAKVTVKDDSGKTYKAELRFDDDDDDDDDDFDDDRYDYDDDECTIVVKGAQKGKNYTFSLSGVKLARSNSYTTVTGSFYISK